MISFVYVTLTSVLLLNMLIAMMAKTFDNISEASATNYLFLFAQRTLGLRNEAPTPPPLNALGLPCEAICRLWAWLYPDKVAKHEFLSVYLKSIGAIGTDAAVAAVKVGQEKAAQEKATTAAAVTLEASPSSRPPSPSSCEVTPSEETPLVKEMTFVEKIKPLAEEITEYIQDHQDDAAQEERWRTTMKRDIGKNFRTQRKAIDEILRKLA